MFKVLKSRNFLFLTLSSSVSQFGDRLTYMVIVTLIGAVDPGRIGAFSELSVYITLPVILLAPIAGVVVDHVSKRKIMFRVHVIQALIIAATPVFMKITGSASPIWIAVILFFGLDVFNNAARSAMVPTLIEPANLLAANSVLMTVLRIATFASMVLGGVLIAKVGWLLGFYIDASTHLAAGLLILGMAIKGLEVNVPPLLYKDIFKSVRQFYRDLWELLVVLTRDRLVIFVMISVWVLPFVAAVSHTILVYMVQQVLGFGIKGVGWLGGVIGVGMLIGALVIGSLARNLNRAWVIIGSIAVMGLLFIIGPLHISWILLYSIAFIAGVLFSFIGICQETLLQEKVLANIRGRIFSTREFIASASFLTSALTVGLLSIATQYKILLVAIGGFLVLVAFITLIIVPRSYLRKM